MKFRRVPQSFSVRQLLRKSSEQQSEDVAHSPRTLVPYHDIWGRGFPPNGPLSIFLWGRSVSGCVPYPVNESTSLESFPSCMCMCGKAILVPFLCRHVLGTVHRDSPFNSFGLIFGFGIVNAHVPHTFP